MNESLLSRVGRFVSGSMNPVFTAAEKAAPETVMTEALQEVDQAIDDVRAEAGKVKARKHNANQRLAAEKNRHEELTKQIKLVLKEGWEDLAEAAAATQLDIEAQLTVLVKTIADADDREAELENFIRALQGKKREMDPEFQRVKATLNDATVNTENGRGQIDRSVDKATTTFYRVASIVTGSLSRAVATDPAKLAELEEMSRKSRVQERLEKFRKEGS